MRSPILSSHCDLLTTFSGLLAARIYRAIAAESPSLPWADTSHPSYNMFSMLDHEVTTVEVEGFNLDSSDLLRFAAGNVLARNSIAGSFVSVAIYRLIP